MSFGKAEHGKLCHGPCFDARSVPTAVEALRAVELAEVHSLSTHALALTVAGELVSWGTHGAGATGARDQQALNTTTTTTTTTEPKERAEESLLSDDVRDAAWPRVLQPLASFAKVTSVACGLGHALALLAPQHTGSRVSRGNVTFEVFE